MAKIKIKDLSKGVKITEEELKQVRGGFTPKPCLKYTPIRPPTNPDMYGSYDATTCQYLRLGGGICGF